VVSHHEQFGALAAALVAERLGLPGAAPEAILAAQHKLHARRVLQQVAPEANLGFAELDADYGADIPEGLAYPAFVKPVKAAFSVLARLVRSRDELQAHTRFGRRELWVIRRLVEPFERVLRERLPQAGSAHRMMLEEPCRWARRSSTSTAGSSTAACTCAGRGGRRDVPRHAGLHALGAPEPAARPCSSSARWTWRSVPRGHRLQPRLLQHGVLPRRRAATGWR
jgi:hypothetical protein